MALRLLIAFLTASMVLTPTHILQSSPATTERSIRPDTRPFDFHCHPAPEPAVLVTLPELNDLAFLDPTTHQIEQLDTFPGQPTRIFMDPARRVAFVAVSSGIEVYNLACQESLGIIPISGSMQVSDDGAKLFVLAGNSVSIVSVHTESILATESLPAAAQSFAYSSVSHEIFVTPYSQNAIDVFDLRPWHADQTLYGGLCNPNPCFPTGSMATTDGQYIFVSDHAGGFTVFGARTHKVALKSQGGYQRNQVVFGEGPPEADDMATVANVYLTREPFSVVELYSGLPPFRSLYTWYVSKDVLTAVCFDSSGFGYALGRHGYYVLGGGGAVTPVQLNTTPAGAAYYP